MKIIFFSDIHGNNHAFDAFVKDLSEQKGQYKLVFLGDFVGYYYGANEIITYCREKNISCILGNHDSYFLRILDGKLSIETFVKNYGRSYEVALNTISDENIEFLRQLDKNKILTSPNKKAYICHGSPINNLEGRIYPNTDLSLFEKAIEGFNYIITGHTHHKMNKRFCSTVFLNPGSLGQQRDGRGCSYMTLDLEKDVYSFHTVNYLISNLEREVDFYDAGRKNFKEVLRRNR